MPDDAQQQTGEVLEVVEVVTVEDAQRLVDDAASAAAAAAAGEVAGQVTEGLQGVSLQTVAIDAEQWAAYEHYTALQWFATIMCAALAAGVVGVGLAQLLSKRWG